MFEQMPEENSILPYFQIFKQQAEPLLNKLASLRSSVVFPLLFHIQAYILPYCVSKIYDRIAEKIEKVDEIKDMDVVLFSIGGNLDTAFHIARILHRSVKGNLTFIVPRIAMSAATLLTFAGDKILMNSPSQLGPIDPQIETSPGNIVSVRSLKETLNLLIGKIVETPNVSRSLVEAFLEELPLMEMVDYERLLEHTEELASELLRLRMIKDEGKAKEIARMFVREFKYHGKAITIDECVAIGLNVEEMKGKEWKIVWEFNKLWEEIANIKGEVGSKIIALEIGDGIAFVPSLRAKEST